MNCETVERLLNKYVETNDFPNLMLHGPAGTGKTTLIRKFILQCYGKNVTDYCYKMINLEYNLLCKSEPQHILSLNCISNRGIQFVREELLYFAKTNVAKTSDRPFKIICLYNADLLTYDAQSALRRMIELHSKSNKFFFIVRNINNILEPIISRFSVIRLSCGKKMHSFYRQNMIDSLGNLSSMVAKVSITKKLNSIWDRIGNSKFNKIDICNEVLRNGISMEDINNFVVKKRDETSNMMEKIRLSKILVGYNKIKMDMKDNRLAIMTILSLLEIRSIEELEYVVED